jgi:hypothetical protein
MFYMSPIYFRFNTYPEEVVCVGLILLNSETNQVKAKLSDVKLKLARKIAPNKAAFKLFKMSVTQLVSHEEYSLQYLDRLYRYQNGLIKLDRPSPIACESFDIFDDLFFKRIEEPFIK